MWKENLEKIEREKDSAGAWALVKRLGGGREKEGGDLVYRNRRCLTERAKAKAFIEEYAWISRGKSDKNIRRSNVLTAHRMREHQGEGDEEMRQPFHYERNGQWAEEDKG